MEDSLKSENNVVLVEKDKNLSVYDFKFKSQLIDNKKDSIYSSIQKTYTHTGFRKGMVPKNLIKSDTKINHSGLQESVYKEIIDEYIVNAFTQEELSNIFSYKREFISWTNDEDVVITVKVYFKPTLILPNYISDTEQKQINISDKIISTDELKQKLKDVTYTGYTNKFGYYDKVKEDSELDDNCILLLVKGESHIPINLKDDRSDTELQKKIKEEILKDGVILKIGQHITLSGTQDEYKIEDQYKYIIPKELKDEDVQQLKIFDWSNQEQPELITTLENITKYIDSIIEDETYIEKNMELHKYNRILDLFIEDSNLEVSDDFIEIITNPIDQTGGTNKDRAIVDLKYSRLLDIFGKKYMPGYENLNQRTIIESEYWENLRLNLSQSDVTLYRIPEKQFKELLLKLFYTEKNKQSVGSIEELLESIKFSIASQLIVENIIKEKQNICII